MGVRRSIGQTPFQLPFFVLFAAIEKGEKDISLEKRTSLAGYDFALERRREASERATIEPKLKNLMVGRLVGCLVGHAAGSSAYRPRSILWFLSFLSFFSFFPFLSLFSLSFLFSLFSLFSFFLSFPFFLGLLLLSSLALSSVRSAAS